MGVSQSRPSFSLFGIPFFSQPPQVTEVIYEQPVVMPSAPNMSQMAPSMPNMSQMAPSMPNMSQMAPPSQGGRRKSRRSKKRSSGTRRHRRV